MTKRSALDIVYRAEKKEFVKILVYEEILNEIEPFIQNFVESQSELCVLARNEGWLGSTNIKKCNKGLLGYLRVSFAIQYAILNKSLSPLPIWHSEFSGFFRSDFFKNKTLENGYVKLFYKKEHLDLIKQRGF